MICFLFGFIGLGLNVFFSALKLARKRRRNKRGYLQLTGYTSAIYFPLYFTAPLWFWLAREIGLLNDHWAVRGLAYTLMFYTTEYISMIVCVKLTGTSPSRQSYLRGGWDVGGLVNLSLAPAWFILGLLFEQILLTINL